MTAEILQLMEQRQKTMDRKSNEYRHLNEEIKIKCRNAKEKWLNAECEKVEQLKQRDP